MLMEIPEKDCPKQVNAHSMRKMSTSVTFEEGFNIETICQTVTLRNAKAFFRFYNLDVNCREDTLSGLMVLQLSVQNVHKRFDMLHPKPRLSSHKPGDPKSIPAQEVPSTSRARTTTSNSQAPWRLKQSTLPHKFHLPHCHYTKCRQHRK